MIIDQDLGQATTTSLFFAFLIGVWFVVRHFENRFEVYLASIPSASVAIVVHHLFVYIFDSIGEAGVKGISHATLDNLMAIPFSLGVMYLVSTVVKSIKDKISGKPDQ